MALLAEYSLTPDVLDPTCYSSDEVCGIHLQHLKEAMLTEGMVRNLCDGQWVNVFQGANRAWHKRGQELVKKLATQNRLRPHPRCGAAVPATDREWCDEAVHSHVPATSPLDGIIATASVQQHFAGNALVAAVDKLPTAPWWAARSPSVRPGRTLAEYQKHLGLVLKCANSLMIIDAHFDPSVARYRDAVTLICGMAGRRPKPLIEIHRVCYDGSGPNRQIIPQAEFQRRFTVGMEPQLRAAGLSAEIFVWDDFHDRYIISDLIGIGMQNGLDTARAANAITTWHRLGRKDRDDIQREFDRASNHHALRPTFQVP